MNPTKYAARQGVTRQSVLKAIKVGRLTLGRPGAAVTQDARGHYEIDPKLADVEWEGSTDPTRKPSAEPGQGESFADAKARRERALATMAEDELKRRRGEVILAKDVEHGLINVFSACRTRLLALPTRLRADCPEMGIKGFLAAEQVVRDCLIELSAADFAEGA